MTDDKMKNLNPILAAEQKGRTEVVEWLFPMMDKSLIKTGIRIIWLIFTVATQQNV